MTAGAHYQQNQAANAIPTGTVDVARTDLRYGSVMHFVGDSGAPNTSPAWTITAWPAGSARAQMTNPTTFDATYTPDVPGTYAAQFLVGDGIGANKKDFIFACTQDANGLIVDDGVREPAFGEKVGDDNSAGNDRGYAQPYEGAISNLIPTVTSLANLRNRRANRQKMVLLDVNPGGGVFRWDSASATADDGGATMVQPGFGTGAALVNGRWRRTTAAPAGDLAPTAAGTNVAAITGTAGTAPVHAASLLFDAALTPSIKHATTTGVARDVTIQAQDTDVGNIGGGLHLRSGRGFDSQGVNIWDGGGIAGTIKMITFFGEGATTPQIRFWAGSTGAYFLNAPEITQFHTLCADQFLDSSLRRDSRYWQTTIGVGPAHHQNSWYLGTRFSTDGSNPNERLEVGGNVLIDGNYLIRETIATPTIQQKDVTTAAATGKPLKVQAQNATGTGATVGGSATVVSGTGDTGGDMIVAAGAGSTAVKAGLLTFKSGADIVGQFVSTGSSKQLKLFSTGALQTFQIATDYHLQLISNTVGLGTIQFLQNATLLAVMQSASIDVYVPILQFDTSVAGPTIKQGNKTTASGTGAALTLQAQNETGTGTCDGGALNLGSGTGSSQDHAGAINFKSGADIVGTFASGASSKSLTLFSTGALQTFQLKTDYHLQLMSNQVGSGTIQFLQNATLMLVMQSASIDVYSPLLQFASSVSSPTVTQIVAAAGSHGQILRVTAQSANAGSTDKSGGSFFLSSGAKSPGTGVDGDVVWFTGTTQRLSISGSRGDVVVSDVSTVPSSGQAAGFSFYSNAQVPEIYTRYDIKYALAPRGESGMIGTIRRRDKKAGTVNTTNTTATTIISVDISAYGDNLGFSIRTRCTYFQTGGSSYHGCVETVCTGDRRSGTVTSTGMQAGNAGVAGLVLGSTPSGTVLVATVSGNNLLIQVQAGASATIDWFAIAEIDVFKNT